MLFATGRKSNGKNGKKVSAKFVHKLLISWLLLSCGVLLFGFFKEKKQQINLLLLKNQEITTKIASWIFLTTMTSGTFYHPMLFLCQHMLSCL